MDQSDTEILVEALTPRGEGLGAGQRLPFALPGERVLAPIGAAPITIISASPDRATPICRYFGACGGCAAQHMSASLYGAWKRDSVVAALAKAGVAAKISTLIDAHGEGRRRATFHARYPHGAAPELGFMRARSHDIIDIAACPVLAPGLARAIPAAQALAQDLRGLGKPLDIQITATLKGLDIDIRGCGALALPEMRKLSASAERLDLARISNHAAIVIERRAPQIACGGALAFAPAGGFLQATQAGEELLAARAQAALAGARRVADLFCGAGGFALRLAASHEVHGVDLDVAGIAALRRSISANPQLRALSCETRDLVARPLRADELDRFDAVLFDPPRAGAQAQAQQIAVSGLTSVFAISCDAASFARDARILVDAGFELGEVALLDQFRYSPHVEIAAHFERRAARKKKRSVLG